MFWLSETSYISNIGTLSDVMSCTMLAMGNSTIKIVSSLRLKMQLAMYPAHQFTWVPNSPSPARAP